TVAEALLDRILREQATVEIRDLAQLEGPRRPLVDRGVEHPEEERREQALEHGHFALCRYPRRLLVEVVHAPVEPAPGLDEGQEQEPTQRDEGQLAASVDVFEWDPGPSIGQALPGTAEVAHEGAPDGAPTAQLFELQHQNPCAAVADAACLHPRLDDDGGVCEG